MFLRSLLYFPAILMQPDIIMKGTMEKLPWTASVMAGREVIKTPEEFAKCTDRLVKGVHCVYQPIEEMLEEPEYIKKAPCSNNMQILKVHKAHRVITRNAFYCMQLCFIATDGNRSMISGTKRMMGQNRVVILTWLETIESIPSVPNVLMKKTGKIGSTAVNGTTRDASMFEFMTFDLKFGIFYLIMFKLGIFMSDGHFRFLPS